MSEEERKQIEFEAASRCKELTVAIKRACDSFGLDIHTQESGNEFIAKRVHKGTVVKRLRLEVDVLYPKILWQCCNPNETRGEITFEVHNGSVCYVVSGHTQLPNDLVFLLTKCLTGKIE